MTPEQVITLAQNAIVLTLTISAPLLLVGMIVGILISLFQATTQIQEMTLTFVPKIVAILATLLFFASWMMTKMINYTQDLISSLPMLIR
ncbi:MAG: EscS/YscS/HrcS family type III secretion system export apparatus protein [Deltaproteobacteria bacterium RIFOXYD12_FULL_50_9]|nr:MAG: EscS/YscS/HrcS family type III secretion system export apparatus protein [Deltaproteobacteria bacterium RIFOXYD12_FULL_50_9]